MRAPNVRLDCGYEFICFDVRAARCEVHVAPSSAAIVGQSLLLELALFLLERIGVFESHAHPLDCGAISTLCGKEQCSRPLLHLPCTLDILPFDRTTLP